MNLKVIEHIEYDLLFDCLVRLIEDYDASVERFRADALNDLHSALSRSVRQNLGLQFVLKGSGGHCKTQKVILLLFRHLALTHLDVPLA